MAPSVLFKLALGTIVTVRYDNVTLAGASYQGIQGNTALFRVGAVVHHIVLHSIYDISF